MSKYKCNGCTIECECEIPDECDFVPEGCLAKLENYETKWEGQDG